MHAYTRPTQIRNRCIEGGKGRGVLGDFRMARVSTSYNAYLVLNLTHYVVPLSNERPRWEFTRCEES